MSLNVQQMHRGHQEDMHEQDRRLGVIESQQAEILRILRSQFPPPQ